MADYAEPVSSLVASFGLSLLAYLATSWLVPRVGPSFVAKGLQGIDMLKGYARNKSGKLQGPALPESMGVVAAAVYILLLCCFAPLPYLPHMADRNVDYTVAFPHHSLATYLAAILSLLIAAFLGFLDDVFDIRWRYKLPIPIIASVPLLVVYFAGQGATDVVIPKVLGFRSVLHVEHVQGVLKLGSLYYLYMAMLSTFCTNSINILAGVNGVEVGQTVVIAISIALNDLLYLSFTVDGRAIGFDMARGSAVLADRHLFSLYFMLPLIGTCIGLLKHNWYPARAFVGDTFCYFAGMAFAVVGILGHFSKTLILFFLPQAFNFVLSCPQLFGLVPCPRHRLPKYNSKTGLLEASQALFVTPPTRAAHLVLKTLSALRLVRVTYASDGHTILACTNLTLISAVLVMAGPMREDVLCSIILAIQIAGSVVAFTIRHALAFVFYGPERR